MYGVIAGWDWLELAGWLDPLSSWPGDGLAGGGLGDTCAHAIYTTRTREIHNTHARDTQHARARYTHAHARDTQHIFKTRSVSC